METQTKKLKDWYDPTIFDIIIPNIKLNFPELKSKDLIKEYNETYLPLELKDREAKIASLLKKYLPNDYATAIDILTKSAGPENPNQTGMFTHHWWITPYAKFVELYGLEHLTESVAAIEVFTKRATGEFAVRPFIERYPQQMIDVATKWAKNNNFHLRRLASEGLRPKLPWARKLSLFIENPKPVFDILELLKADDIMFVKKSVANHMNDYIKVNPDAAFELIEKWAESQNPNTKWILKHATRNLRKNKP